MLRGWDRHYLYSHFFAFISLPCLETRVIKPSTPEEFHLAPDPPRIRQGTGEEESKRERRYFTCHRVFPPPSRLQKQSILLMQFVGLFRVFVCLSVWRNVCVWGVFVFVCFFGFVRVCIDLLFICYLCSCLYYICGIYI